MLERLQGTDSVETARTVAAVARENRVSVLAAGLAYHAFNSLIPAAILAVLLVSVFDEVPALLDLFSTATGVRTDQFVEPVRRATNESAGQLRAVVIAGVVLVWSSGRLFEAVQRTFTEVYDSEPYASLVEKLRDIVVAAASILVGTLLVTALGTWLVYVTDEWFLRLLAPPLLLVALTLVFLPMYYLFPRKPVSLREAVPGAAFAAVVWVVSAIGFSLYASTAESVELYGVAGGVLLLLSWMYVVGLAFPVGTILNAVAAGADHGLETPD